MASAMTKPKMAQKATQDLQEEKQHHQSLSDFEPAVQGVRVAHSHPVQ